MSRCEYYIIDRRVAIPRLRDGGTVTLEPDPNPFIFFLFPLQKKLNGEKALYARCDIPDNFKPTLPIHVGQEDWAMFINIREDQLVFCTYAGISYALPQPLDMSVQVEEMERGFGVTFVHEVKEEEEEEEGEVLESEKETPLLGEKTTRSHPWLCFFFVVITTLLLVVLWCSAIYIASVHYDMTKTFTRVGCNVSDNDVLQYVCQYVVTPYIANSQEDGVINLRTRAVSIYVSLSTDTPEPKTPKREFKCATDVDFQRDNLYPASDLCSLAYLPAIYMSCYIFGIVFLVPWAYTVFLVSKKTQICLLHRDILLACNFWIPSNK
jgi:hypothetical protein